LKPKGRKEAVERGEGIVAAAKVISINMKRETLFETVVEI